VRVLPPRLRLSAWAAARAALTALRERRLTRPLAEALIARARAAPASGETPVAREEAEREAAARQWLREAQPLQPVPGRIAMVCGSLSPGGSERQLAMTVRGLAERGIGDITVLCGHLKAGQPEAYDFYRDDITAAGAAIRAFGGRPLLLGRLPPGLLAAEALPASLVCDVVDLWRVFRDLRPAVVHAWLDWANIRAGIAAVLAGVPRILLSGRNVNPSSFFFHEAAMRPVYRALLARPEVFFINNSLAGARDYAAWLDLPAERIGILRNGFNLPPADPPSAAAERRRLGLPEGTLVVGSMFRFQPEKRITLWLEAAAALRARHPAAMFMLFGAGPLLPEVRRRAAALGLEPQLLLPGLTRDPLAAIGAMDAFLLTSEAEGTPNVLLEAQWAGTPVVATEAGGVAEALQPGVTGILVARPDPAVIAEAVLTVAGPEWRERVRTAGPAFVTGRFGLARMIDETLAAYGFEGRRSELATG
jgi:glycosyltransferase involved in cell wall biosynthesis